MSGAFTCRKCEVGRIAMPEFNRETELEGHIRLAHLSWNPFRCLYCEVEAASATNLKSHVSKSHPQEKFQVIYTPDEEKEEALEWLKKEGNVPSSNTSTKNNVNIQTVTIKEEIDLAYSLDKFPSSGPSTSGYNHSTNNLAIVSPKRSIGSHGEQEQDSNDLHQVESMANFEGEPGPSSTNRPCRLCLEIVNHRDMEHHVRTRHVNKYAFQCGFPGCNFGAERIKTIRLHTRTSHGDVTGQVETIDNRSKVDAECKGLTEICFYSPNSYYSSTCNIKDARELEASHTSPSVYDSLPPDPNPHITAIVSELFSSSNRKRNSDSTSSHDDCVITSAITTEEVEQEVFKPKDTSRRSAASAHFETLLCQICHSAGNPVHVRNTNLKQHVYIHHIRKPAIRCPWCNRSDYFQVNNIKLHMRTQHADEEPREVIDERSLHENEYLVWKRWCFGQNQRLDLEGSNTARAYTPEAKKQRISSELASSYLDPDLKCNKCQRTISTANKHIVPALIHHHIFVHHIRKPVIKCPHCDVTDIYDIQTVQKHIYQAHPHEQHRDPIDERLQFQLEFGKLSKECFGDVLFSPFTGSPNPESAGGSNVPTGTTSSNTKYSVTCNVCRKRVNCSNPNAIFGCMRQHIFCNHIRQPAIRCPYEGCHHSDFFNFGNVNYHIRRHHADEPWRNPIDERHLYEEECDKLKAVCFPVGQDAQVTVTPTYYAHEEAAVSAHAQGQPHPLPLPSTEAAKVVTVTKALGAADADPGREACNQCGMLVSVKKAHIFIHHMQKPAVRCPYENCGHFDYWTVNNVTAHIKSKHKNDLLEQDGLCKEPIDERHLYLDEYLVWLRQCFGSAIPRPRPDPAQN